MPVAGHGFFRKLGNNPKSGVPECFAEVKEEAQRAGGHVAKRSGTPLASNTDHQPPNSHQHIIMCKLVSNFTENSYASR